MSWGLRRHVNGGMSTVFHDYEALVKKLLQADPEWQYQAVKQIKTTLADHDDWSQSGKPPRAVWSAYKRLRDPDSYRWSNRPLLLEKITAYDLVDPCPMTWQEWATVNPDAAEWALRLYRNVDAHLLAAGPEVLAEACARRKKVMERQEELRLQLSTVPSAQS